MIVRVVRMHFRTDAVDDFLSMFDSRKERIRHFSGCNHLELWQDANNQDVYYTYSYWDDEAALNHYRFSDFFKETWSITKSLFQDKPQAWSTIPIIKV